MIEVAMGIILDHEGKILIAQRDRSKRFGGLWEFPGGKIEEGESPEQALTRELVEELGVEVDTDHLKQIGSVKNHCKTHFPLPVYGNLRKEYIR